MKIVTIGHRECHKNSGLGGSKCHAATSDDFDL